MAQATLPRMLALLVAAAATAAAGATRDSDVSPLGAAMAAALWATETPGGPPGAVPQSRANALAGRGGGIPAQCDSGGEQLSLCLNQLPPMLRNASRVGIPASKEEIDTSCSAFKTGMGCVEDYAKACLSDEGRRILEQQVAGANYTFHFLCNDKKFQAEYLQYTSCYRGISRDWDSCANRFMQLVREEMGRRNATEQQRMLEVCCAKYGFLRCVYVASRTICRKEEALFLNRIAETLSAVRFYSPVCDSAKHLDMAAVCGAVRHDAPAGALALALAMALAMTVLLPWALGEASTQPRARARMRKREPFP